ncbi:unnamed protein product [Didymodactylos carnosus]|uniref:Uncharacterized protein n=1 Tax=Didymodactylos carnosus TaxID=1234261 RepID=A0A8S2FSX6_9BILA|nr:unnamed protein product [Didymodactylos carnosus]CAF4340899.1 unnamed protein product [Didymodactylos carnosus]
MASFRVRPIPIDSATTTTVCISPDINYEDVTLDWIDSHVNKTDDCLDTRRRLGTTVNYLKVFDDSQTSVDYVRSALNGNIFLIVSGLLGGKVTFEVHDEPQLKFIYVFCLNREIHAQWTQNTKKFAEYSVIN